MQDQSLDCGADLQIIDQIVNLCHLRTFYFYEWILSVGVGDAVI